MKKLNYKLILLVEVFLLFLGMSMHTYAKEYESEEQISEEQISEENPVELRDEDILDKIDMSEINKVLYEVFPSNEIDFPAIVKSVLKGDLKISQYSWSSIIKNNVLGGLSENRAVFFYIVLLGIVSALFVNFSGLFENHQIVDICYYFIYLFLIILLLKSFTVTLQIASEAIDNILLFMKVAVPAYACSVALTASTSTAIVFYQLALILIFLMDAMLLHFVIPVIQGYMMLGILNGISGEERFQGFLELIRKGIEIILKTSIGLVVGISALQSLIAPVIDSLRVTTVKKVISAIPGIGDVADSFTEVMFGSAILIKNSIGVAALLILLIICAGPIIKLLVMTVLLKLAEAIVGIVAEKRLTRAVKCVGNAGALLCRTMLTATALFMIVIAIIAVTTNRGF